MTNILPPRFPIPPKEYSPEYFSEFIRLLSLYIQQAQNPGEARNTKQTLTHLQRHDQGLSPGELFMQEGEVKIAVENKIYLAPCQPKKVVVGKISEETS